MEVPKFPPTVKLEEDKVIVWDEKIGSILYKNGFFGKPLGLRKAKPGKLNRPLTLSLFDALYLLKKNIIKIEEQDKLLNPNQFEDIASNYHDDFAMKYRVYEHLREKGYVVRPGMKFGSDFVIYEKGPGIDHSKWVVHVEKDQKKLRAIEVVRAGRLAASVKKKYLIATEYSKDTPVFYAFDRVKI